jgi:nucleotide-binding universal stress UspA family protein
LDARPRRSRASPPTSDAELIVVGSRGRGAFAAALLGSVSRTLARTTPCALAIVTPSAAERHALGTNGVHGPIVCGIDGTERALAGAQLAGALARRLGERLLLAHVRDYPTTGAVGRRSERDVVRAAVAALDTEVEIAIEEGPAAHGLLSLAARTRARMIVVAPRGPVGGVRAAFLGSVSSFLASNAPCPLVVPAAPRPG